jgi:hypothetical protein
LTVPVAIFGGPGSGAVVAQSVAALAARGEGIQVVGFLNDVLSLGEVVSGVPVIGPFASWGTLADDVQFIAPLHKAKVMQERARIIEALDERGSAGRHDWTRLLYRPFVSAGPGARLGAHTVLRAGAHVGHDCRIGDFVFVGANAVICGFSTVQDGAYVAPSATISDRRQVGKFAVVGLGAVVTKDVADFQAVYGVPARGP